MKCRYIKRILSFLLAFMILFTTIPFSVYADDEGSGSGSHSSSIGGNTNANGVPNLSAITGGVSHADVDNMQGGDSTGLPPMH